MYWKSKKSVYGIDNELHLVEQIQNCMKVIFSVQILQRKTITHKDIKEIFDNEFEKSDDSSDEEAQKQKVNSKAPELDEHMFLALKIAFNLKELTYQ